MYGVDGASYHGSALGPTRLPTWSPVACGNVRSMVPRMAEGLCQNRGSGSGWDWGPRSIPSKSQMLVCGQGLWLRSEAHSWQRAGVSLWLELGQEAHTDWGQGSNVAVAKGRSVAGSGGHLC